LSDDIHEREKDDPVFNGIWISLIASAVVWSVSGSAALAAGLGIFLFLWISGRLTLLGKHIGLNVGEADRGLEDGFIVNQNDADTYWSSYDPGKIWEQRSAEIEAGAYATTHYAELRTRIPQLSDDTLTVYVHVPIVPAPHEPLSHFWSRYSQTQVNGLGFSPSLSGAGGSSLPEFQPQPTPDYSHLAPHLALIAETEGARQKLRAAAQQETGEFGSDLAKMVVNVDTIIDGIRTTPAKLGDVQRLFTYYLPQVAKLLDARQHMRSLGESERVREIEAILDRIETAFAQLAARLHEADIRALDIDLKLLDQSLAGDFETRIGT
jgi:5-bromo-4-chloroindolyl phosphate hydrolysis protein